MVNANSHIAATNQLFGDQLGLIYPLTERRQACLVDTSLVCFQSWQMSVTETRDPVRLHGADKSARLANRFQCLQRKPIDQIEVEIPDACGSKSPGGPFNVRKRLDSADRRLNHRI